jgi:VanZ family protein
LPFLFVVKNKLQFPVNAEKSFPQKKPKKCGRFFSKKRHFFGYFGR